MAADFENRTRGTERRYPNGERMPDEEIPVDPNEEPVDDAPHVHGNERFAPAIVLVAVGAIFLLANLGLFNFRDIWRYWPIALIVIGVLRLSSSKKEEKASAAVMLIVGAVFLVTNLGLFHISFGLLWPVGLIALGALMFTGGLGTLGSRKYGCGKGRRKRRIKIYGPQPSEPFYSAPAPSTSSFADADNTLDNWALFGGVSRVIMSQNFKGGQLFAAFGGIEIDLRRAQIANNGRPAVISANAAFGGISIKVPDTWRIAVRGVGIFGGYQDESVQMRNPDPAAPLLIISGYAAFGGVVIE